MPRPDFKHKSWDATGWSLWGLLYTGAASDRALQTALSQRFDDAVDLLGQLGAQAEPMASRVQEWKDEVASYGRTISFGEANDVLARLGEIVSEIRAQLERDRLMARAAVKPAPKKKKKGKGKGPKRVQVAAPAAPVADDDEDEDDGPTDEDLEWAMRYAHTSLGHTPSTATSRPKVVKAAPYVPPTPEELWQQEQRTMATRCDNGINFGAHPVNQAAVIERLHLARGDGGVEQYRPGPENGHERIMRSRNGVYYWTLGLSHEERRRAGNFSVYRRVGTSNRFEFVSGQRHPKDTG